MRLFCNLVTLAKMHAPFLMITAKPQTGPTPQTRFSRSKGLYQDLEEEPNCGVQAVPRVELFCKVLVQQPLILLNLISGSASLRAVQ